MKEAKWSYLEDNRIASEGKFGTHHNDDANELLGTSTGVNLRLQLRLEARERHPSTKGKGRH